MTSLNTQTKNKRILKALSPILIIEENKEDKLISVSIAMRQVLMKLLVQDRVLIMLL